MSKKKDDASLLDDVLEEVHSYIQVAMEETLSPEENWVQRQLELHPSSFPYCPLKHMYSALQRRPEAFGNVTFGDTYFVSVGRLVHLLIQRFMGLGGRVWGHWKCVHHDSGKCKYQDLEEISAYHNCPVCGNRCEYEEVGHNIDDVLIGHQDCLYEDSNNNFWILDYKTCTLLKAQKHVKDGVTLSKNNVYRAQQRAYVTLSHRKYAKSHGIRPKGWILVYLPRDNPFNFQLYGEVVSIEEKKQIWEQIDMNIQAVTDVLDAESYKDIKKWIPLKPCSSLAQYKETVHDEHNPCPLTAVCFNGQLENTLKNEMEGHVLLPLRQHYHKAMDLQRKVMAQVKKAQAIVMKDDDD